jgi:signal transduction histidine kinase
MRAPRFGPLRSGHLIGLFLLVTVLPAALLVALGWRLFRDDQADEARHRQDRREQALAIVAASLERQVIDVERVLHSNGVLPGFGAGSDAAVVSFSEDGVDVRGPGRLPYLPVTTPGRDAGSEQFAAGEALEYRQQNPARAAAWYEREAATTRDAAVRGGALIRLARSARKLGQVDRALQAYAAAAKIDAVAVAGMPVALLAEWAQCDVLASTGRTADLRQAATRLLHDLRDGRWALDRAAYDVQLTDASHWAQATGPPARAPLQSEAAAIDWLWRRWRQQPRDAAPFSGQTAQVRDGALVTIIWNGDGQRLSAFVAGPAFIDRWLADTGPLVARQHVAVTLHEDAPVSGLPNETRLPATDSRLPWTVVVANTDVEASAAASARRRTFWLSGLALLGVLVIAGAFVVARATAREVQTARLQADFVSAVSHEFRTPLTTMRQVTEMLMDERVSAPGRRLAYVQALARQTDRLQRLVESLLDFGRLDAGTTPYRLESLNASDLVAATVVEFTADAAARGYDVATSFPSEAPWVEGDARALHTALWNLLDNAVKYSPGAHSVRARVQCNTTEAAIAVQDFGLGVSSDERDAIFGKFVRGSAATAEGITGTGIGLAMVQHIVSSHGGRVTVDSEPGRGSTFTIWLPRSQPPRIPALAPDVASPRQMRREA